MTDLPSIRQIELAQVPLDGAYATAVGISYYVLGREGGASLDFLRRSLINNLRQAATALGYDLVPRSSPALVIDNTEINTMGR